MLICKKQLISYCYVFLLIFVNFLFKFKDKLAHKNCVHR